MFTCVLSITFISFRYADASKLRIKIDTRRIRLLNKNDHAINATARLSPTIDTQKVYLTRHSSYNDFYDTNIDN